MDWGGNRGDTEFCVMGGQSRALCRWNGVVIGVIRTFLLWKGKKVDRDTDGQMDRYR